MLRCDAKMLRSLWFLEIKKSLVEIPINSKTLESFDATIHSTPHQSNTEKMNYLVNFLVGEAETAVEGLTLDN